jgi:hypothetical protein
MDGLSNQHDDSYHTVPGHFIGAVRVTAFTDLCNEIQDVVSDESPDKLWLLGTKGLQGEGRFDAAVFVPAEETAEAVTPGCGTASPAQPSGPKLLDLIFEWSRLCPCTGRARLCMAAAQRRT